MYVTCQRKKRSDDSLQELLFLFGISHRLTSRHAVLDTTKIFPWPQDKWAGDGRCFPLLVGVYYKCLDLEGSKTFGHYDSASLILRGVHDTCSANNNRSTIIVEKSIQDLMSLMQDLSTYSNQFLEMICDKLKEYKEICNTAYRSIVQCEEKLTISASWAKDEDISRLLQSLPNWSNMTQPRQVRQKREDEEDFTRAAFAKESEVLTGNLGDKLIPPSEILRDVSDLKALANLHESMEWLAVCLKGFFFSLPQTSSNLIHARQCNVGEIKELLHAHFGVQRMGKDFFSSQVTLKERKME
ncbi:exocyst complex component 4 [Tachysurus ichikawai]